MKSLWEHLTYMYIYVCIQRGHNVDIRSWLSECEIWIHVPHNAVISMAQNRSLQWIPMLLMRHDQKNTRREIKSAPFLINQELFLCPIAQQKLATQLHKNIKSSHSRHEWYDSDTGTKEVFALFPNGMLTTLAITPASSLIDNSDFNCQ